MKNPGNLPPLATPEEEDFEANLDGSAICFVPQGMTGFDVPGLAIDETPTNKGKSRANTFKTASSLGSKLKERFGFKSFRMPESTEGTRVPSESASQLEPDDFGLQHVSKLKVRKTCGLTLRMRFRTLFVSVVVLIMIVFCVALIVPTTVRMNSVVEQNIEMFQTADNSTNGAVWGLLSQLADTTGHRIGNTASPLQAFTEVQQVVNAIVNSFAGLGKNSSVENHFLHLPFQDGAPSNWDESIGPFLYPAIQTSLYQYINHVYVAFEDDGYFSTAIRKRTLGFGPLGGKNAPPPESNVNVQDSLSYAIKLDSGEQRVNYTSIDPTTGSPNFLKASTTNETIEYRNTPWYKLQVSFSKNDKSPAGGWTPFYEFQSISPGSYDEFGGVSFTYPILDNCSNYTCLEGVVGADIGMETFSSLSCEQLVEIGSGLDTINCQDTEEAVLFYVMLGGETSGIMLGYSGHTQGSKSVEYALDSSIPLIRNASTYVVEHFDEAAPYPRQVTNATWGTFTGETDINSEPKTWIVDLVEMETCTDDSVASLDIQRLAMCHLVVYSGSRAINASYFPSGNEIYVGTITVLPYSYFLKELGPDVGKTEQKFQADIQQEKDLLRNDMLRNVGLSIGFIIAGIVIAVILSRQIDKPLQRLRQSMKDLIEFDDDAQAPPLQHGSRIAELFEVQQTLEILKGTVTVFSKFVPKAVVRGIVRNERNARRLYVRQREVTVMFADLADFTSISERVKSRDLMFLLTRYLTIMTRIVESYGGTVGEILGDGILAFWNTPTCIENHASLACASAVALQLAMTQINDEVSPILGKYSLGLLEIRIGIHTGEVLTGNIGSSSKMKFGCLGDTINLASRIEGLCKLYDVGIMCTGDTLTKLIPDVFQICELDMVTVKGREEPTRVFEVLTMPGTINVQTSANWASGESDPPPSVEKHAANKDTTPYCCFRMHRSTTPQGGHLSPTSSASSSALPGVASIGPMGEEFSQQELDRISLYITIYTQALRAYQAGYFEVAERAMSSLPYQKGSSRLLLEKIKHGKSEHGKRAKGAWDGITNLKEKAF